MFNKITILIAVVGNFFLVNAAQAQQVKPMTEEAMFYCMFIGERFFQTFKSDPNPKMKELSSIGGAVWDGYIPFAKRYAAQNKFSDTAIAAAKNAVASQPLEGLIQPLLNCRDNPKNRITVR
jgi:hypothetical protein